MATDQLDLTPTPSDAEALDAYSTVVTSVAERLLLPRAAARHGTRRPAEAGGGAAPAW
jgi:hypothetical protein